MRLVIVTGMSGGGKTQICRALEDLGFFCVDNLPPVLIPKFVQVADEAKGHIDKVALVVDTRSREFFSTFLTMLDSLANSGVKYDLLYADATDETIVRRYKETRRTHPMAPKSLITEGIKRERERLAPVRIKANYIIDTSKFSKMDLKEKIQSIWGKDDSREFTVNVISFGFKFGLPLDADMVVDVRFLPNPFYVEELKYKSGIMPEIVEYIESHEVTGKFMEKLDDMIDFLIPEYKKEGKTQFVIALGCTGGLHRSVYTAKHIYDRLLKKGINCRIEHRDLMKNDVREHIREEN